MKNTIALITLAVVIGFSMVSCDGGVGGMSGEGTLNLSGRVYYQEPEPTETVFTYKPYNGKDLTVTHYLGGNGKIENGNFSYSIGTPSPPDLLDFEIMFNRFDNVTSSVDNVMGSEISDFWVDFWYVEKLSRVSNIGKSSFSQTSEDVKYLYVDSDVTVTGKGKKVGPVTDTRGGVVYTETRITKDFRLELKEGWNSIYTRRDESGTFTGTFEAPTSITGTITYTVALKNPSLKWVLGPYTAPPSLPPTSCTSLVENVEKDGNLPNKADKDFYSFDVTAGKLYSIYLNDEREGDTTKTGRVEHSAWYSDQTQVFIVERSNEYPISFMANKSDTVYLRVTPFWKTGTYGIKYTSP